MKLVFISNLITPHQIPLCDILYRKLGGDFKFIETIEQSIQLPKGWNANGKDFPYVLQLKDQSKMKESINEMISNADCVVIGAAPMNYVRSRLKENKITFMYAERVYKKPFRKIEIPFRTIKYYIQYGRFDSLFLLCASAYTATDYSITHTFKGKAFKWGYFPKTYSYKKEKLMKYKSHKKVHILWSGRMLDWKHPEMAVEVARFLYENRIEFRMKIVGSGPMEGKVDSLIREYKLEDYVIREQEVSPNIIRKYMEDANIFLFTSDRNEGWGASLNEALNSGCVVIANHMIGAVPYLIHNNNGIIYQDGDLDDLCNKCKKIILDTQLRSQMAKAAYFSIHNEWNEEIAADRLVKLIQSFLKGNPQIFSKGICSKAELLNDDWFIR